MENPKEQPVYPFNVFVSDQNNNGISGAAVGYSAQDANGDVYASGNGETDILGTYSFPPAVRAGGMINWEAEATGYQDFSDSFIPMVVGGVVFREVALTPD